MIHSCSICGLLHGGTNTPPMTTAPAGGTGGSGLTLIQCPTCKTFYTPGFAHQCQIYFTPYSN